MSAMAVPRRLQRGQSTTEFVVLALVLVPLFIAVPLLGKYIDMMQTAEVASRYVAFEGTVRNSNSSWKTDAELAVEVRRRFFSNVDAPLKTNDTAGDFAAHRNPVWSDASGKPLIESFEGSVRVRTQVGGKNAIPAAKLLFDWPGELGLSGSNFYTANVTVAPVNVAHFAPFDAIDLSTTRRTVVLADAWTARGPGSIRSKIEGSSKLFPVGPAKPIIERVGMLPEVIFDPVIEVGEFDWDVVPCDRLIGGC